MRRCALGILLLAVGSVGCSVEPTYRQAGKSFEIAARDCRECLTAMEQALAGKGTVVTRRQCRELVTACMAAKGYTLAEAGQNAGQAAVPQFAQRPVYLPDSDAKGYLFAGGAMRMRLQDRYGYAYWVLGE